jgi:hypothetical protein
MAYKNIFNLKDEKMKKLVTNFLTISSIGLLMLTSCKKNDKLVTDTGSTASGLTSSATTLVLDKTRVNDTTSAISFTFTAPKYTYKSAGTNSLQIDVPSDNWKNAATYQLTGSSLTQTFSTLVFDKLLLKLNLNAGQAAQVNVRVVNSLSTETAIYSNVVPLTVTPFNLTAFLYVVGAYQGWNANAPDSLISATSNGVYTGIINFTANNNQFLILPQEGSYNNKYATNDAQGSTSMTVAQNAPNNFYAPSAAGNYYITLDLNNNTIMFESVNYYSVIGSSTPPLGNGFTVDNDMKYVNGDQAWEITIGMVEAGGFKIRQNHDWGFSWGLLPTPDGVTLTDNSGGNIPINVVGTYKVTFSIPVEPYSLGNPPAVTAPYTLVQQ